MKKKLAKKTAFDEGRFRFELLVHCAEDDTKITERLRYDRRNNQVLGLQLPLDEDGKPITGSFKFVSLNAVQASVAENPMTSYAKVMTVRSLTLNSAVHVLVIYGTRGSDKAPDVHARWRFVQREFESIGVEVWCKN